MSSENINFFSCSIYNNWKIIWKRGLASSRTVCEHRIFFIIFYLRGWGRGGRGLHSSPLFRLSNPAVTQPTNRMPSSGLCHLYLSESWRGNKDISSTALVRLLVFTENECGRAEGLRVPLRCREAT